MQTMRKMCRRAVKGQDETEMKREKEEYIAGKSWRPRGPILCDEERAIDSLLLASGDGRAGFLPTEVCFLRKWRALVRYAIVQIMKLSSYDMSCTRFLILLLVENMKSTCK